MKKIIIPILVLGLFVGVLFAREYRLGKYVQEGLYPSDVIIDALDSSAAARSQVLQVITDSATVRLDTIWRTQILASVIGLGHDSVPTASESLYSCLYVVPATGVTSVTIKNISIVADRAPHTHATKIARLRIRNFDASDSAFKNIITACKLDSAGGGVVSGNGDTTLLLARLPMALKIDSTANAVLYPGDAVWSVFFTDSANVYTKDLNVMLNVQINK